MSDPQKEAFLEQEQTGILSVPIGDEGAPYTLPMSFGYDQSRERILFQLVIHEESTKMEFIREGANATLSVVEQLAGMGWVSVTVIGSLRRITGDAIEKARSLFEDSTVGQVNVFADRDDYHVEWWALRIEDSRGRYSKAPGVSLVE